MSDLEYIRLGLRVLDEQIVDSTGRRCGRVEDLEFDCPLGEPTRMIGMLAGATAWKRRLTPHLSELFPGDPAGLSRVPVHEIENAGNEIELCSSESELDQAGDTEAPPLAVSQLIGTSVVTEEGSRLGRIRDVIASRPRGHEEELWQLHGLLIGRRALLQRVGFQPMIDHELREGKIPPNFIPWERVRRFDDHGGVVVTS